jgi:hypothetical protein
MNGKQDNDHGCRRHVPACRAEPVEELLHQVERDDPLLGLMSRVERELPGPDLIENDERQQEDQRCQRHLRLPQVAVGKGPAAGLRRTCIARAGGDGTAHERSPERLPSSDVGAAGRGASPATSSIRGRPVICTTRLP